MAGLLLFPCQPQLLRKHGWYRQCPAKPAPKVIRNQRTSSFSYRSTVNAPLYELPGASFDQYMNDKSRVHRVILPDNGASQQLNEEEWRVKMPPLQYLFLNVQPKADMRIRIKSNGEDYPPEIPRHITKLVEFHITKWELLDLNTRRPHHMNLDVSGAVFPERQGARSWLKNQLEMSISFTVPPALALIPEKVFQNVVETVYRSMLDNMKHEFSGRLLADYNCFKRSFSQKKKI